MEGSTDSLCVHTLLSLYISAKWTLAPMRARKVVSTTGLNFDSADRRRGPRQEFDIALTPE